MFRLTIDTGNDAFTGDALPEIRRLMGVVAKKIGNGQHEGNLLDSNGNTVGQFTFEPEENIDSEQAAQELFDNTVENLDKSYELVEPGQGDSLSDDQIRLLFEGKPLFDDAHFDEWELESEAESTTYIIEDILDEDERDLLERHDMLNDLRTEIQERNSSDPERSLVRMTGNKWMRYRVDFEAVSTWAEDDEDRTAELTELAGLLGIDFDTYRTQLLGMSRNASDGGQVYVLWQGDIEPLVNAAASDAEGTITWTEPSLLTFDTMSGSGWMCELPGATITLPWNRDNLRLDTGTGSWSEWVCGGLYASQTTDVTINEGDNSE